MALAIIPVVLGGLLTTVLAGLFKGIFAYILYKVLSKFFFTILEYVLSIIQGSDLPSGIVQLTSLGAWIADVMELPDTLSVLMSMMITVFIIRILGIAKK